MALSDVIIVGAGAVGTSLAFHLARAGVHVTIFDRSGICAGMTARSGALVRMHYTFAPEAALAWKSLDYFTNWNEIVGGDRESLGCGFVRTGCAVVAAEANVARMNANVAMLRGLGIDTYTLAPEDLREVEPALNVEDAAIAAYEPQSGYADPILTTRSFAAAAVRHGARFLTDTSVVSLIIEDGRAAGVVDEAGKRHEAGVVCVAAGPWTDQLLKPLGAAIGIRCERAQIAFFERAATIRHCACIDTISGSYLRPHGDTLTLAGLGDIKAEYEPGPDDFREENDSDFVTDVAERIAHRIPTMRGAPYARGHAGIYDISPDARAILGPVPGYSGLHVAAGFSGTGFKTSPAVGAAMAEWIIEGNPRTVDIRPFGMDRLREGRLIRGEHEYMMGANFGHKL